MDVDTAGDDGDWSDEEVPEGMFKSSLGRALLQAAGRMEDELELPAASRMTARTPSRTTDFFRVLPHSPVLHLGSPTVGQPFPDAVSVDPDTGTDLHPLLWSFPHSDR
ncbi:hypothetical protein AGABI1DRAFT_133717, partial [Agaricus bisporus var. burnettii JB137-S8]